jgi:triacylglycerol lipase
MSVLTKLAAEVYDRAAFAGFVTQRDFSLANAKGLIWLSQLAYETDEPAKVATLLDLFGLALVPDGVASTPAISPLPIARTEALVATGHGAAFLAFAGTDPLVAANWVTDFDIRRHAETTEGFTLALAPAMPKIRELLLPLGLPIFVTGHSLGGALAAVAALELAKAGASVVAVYTYGMQRPGSTQFKADYDGRLGQTTYRLRYGDDIVPSVAPSFLGFRHVGRLLPCTRGKRFSERDLSADMSSDDPPFVATGRSLFDRLRAPFVGAGPPPLLDEVAPQWAGRPDAVKLLIRLLPQSIRDHLQDSYIAALT